MELHNLKPAAGSTKSRKRIARGQGSGYGGTSTRGHKGAKSRSGYSRKRNFEGGQMPLQMRLPKRGFNNYNRKNYKVLNLSTLEEIIAKHSVKEISLDFLKEKNYIKKSQIVKILGDGELTSSVKVEANACSKSAQSAIEAKGGSITIIS